MVTSCQGQINEAIESYACALKFDPNYALAKNNLAIGTPPLLGNP